MTSNDLLRSASRLVQPRIRDTFLSIGAFHETPWPEKLENVTCCAVAGDIPCGVVCDSGRFKYDGVSVGFTIVLRFGWKFISAEKREAFAKLWQTRKWQCLYTIFWRLKWLWFWSKIRRAIRVCATRPKYRTGFKRIVGEFELSTINDLQQEISYELNDVVKAHPRTRTDIAYFFFLQYSLVPLYAVAARIRGWGA